jgi:hypothetical protein
MHKRLAKLLLESSWLMMAKIPVEPGTKRSKRETVGWTRLNGVALLLMVAMLV